MQLILNDSKLLCSSLLMLAFCVNFLHFFVGVCVLAALLAGTCEGNADLSSIQVRYGTVTYDPNGKDLYISNVTLINSGTTGIDTGLQPVTIFTCFIRYVISCSFKQVLVSVLLFQ